MWIKKISKATTRYYYDSEAGRCVNFLYHGLGNFNNFVTKADCEQFCSKCGSLLARERIQWCASTGIPCE